MSLAVVIPTANRAQLAINAAQSLLGQRGVDPCVFVSDNSTHEAESEQLERFVRSAANPRLVYLRPDVHLAMPTHWDWALSQALERSSASHVMVHYDRKVTKPDALQNVWHAATRFPDQAVTYACDQINAIPRPGTCWQGPWTGRLYTVRTARVVDLTVSASILAMGHVFPILSNCVVPRVVFNAIRARFGNICDSTGPDSCFTYRFVSLADEFVYCDRTIGILYASHRSNGLGYMRHAGGDFPAFMADWGDRPWLDAAPIPGLTLGQNMLFHEYELVRRATGSDRFPPVDKTKYLASLEADLWWIEDDEVRRRVRAVLEQHGLPPAGAQRPTTDALPPASSRQRPWWVRLRHAVPKPVRRGIRALVGRPSALWLAGYAGLSPEYLGPLSFGTDEQALRFCIRFPRRPVPTHEHIENMQAVAISTEDADGIAS